MFLFCLIVFDHFLILKKKKKNTFKPNFYYESIAMGPFQQFFWKRKLIKNLVCSKLSMLCLIYTVMNL